MKEMGVEWATADVDRLADPGCRRCLAVGGPGLCSTLTHLTIQVTQL